jgi:pyruvate/2-oxoglutarate dehydrogenase complex dihydrolipoamide acyltransferase (E2) component
MDRPQSQRVALVVPELGLGSLPVVVSLWLVPAGAAVLAGDRVLELVAGGATIDLEAPVSGRLAAQLVDEDEVVTGGNVVAEFELPNSDADAVRPVSGASG